MESKKHESERISGSHLANLLLKAGLLPGLEQISLGFISKDRDSTTSLGKTWSRAAIHSWQIKNTEDYLQHLMNLK